MATSPLCLAPHSDYITRSALLLLRSSPSGSSSFATWARRSLSHSDRLSSAQSNPICTDRELGDVTRNNNNIIIGCIPNHQSTRIQIQ